MSGGRGFEVGFMGVGGGAVAGGVDVNIDI
jgi:hypothetical protein